MTWVENFVAVDTALEFLQCGALAVVTACGLLLFKEVRRLRRDVDYHQQGHPQISIPRRRQLPGDDHPGATPDGVTPPRSRRQL